MTVSKDFPLASSWCTPFFLQTMFSWRNLQNKMDTWEQLPFCIYFVLQISPWKQGLQKQVRGTTRCVSLHVWVVLVVYVVLVILVVLVVPLVLVLLVVLVVIAFHVVYVVFIPVLSFSSMFSLLSLYSLLSMFSVCYNIFSSKSICTSNYRALYGDKLVQY